MQAVILAAGRGTRLQSLGSSKPLVKLLGMSLIERNIRALIQTGVSDIVIVTGHEAASLEKELAALRKQLPSARLQTIHNPDWASTENGQSLIAAAPIVQSHFILLMADHVYDVALLQGLCAATPPADGAVLAVDKRCSRHDIDLQDVTKVQVDERYISQISKSLSHFNAFDTGAFLCTPGMLKTALETAKEGQSSLSHIMRKLIDSQQLTAYDIGDCYWQDVDTPASFTLAEAQLLDSATRKHADGPVAKHLNRRLSRPISRYFAQYGLSPNLISVIAFCTGILAAWLLSRGGYGSLLIGGVLVQLASVIDGCDGEVARLHLRSSSFGGWFDAILDRYADAAILAGLTWHAMSIHDTGWAFMAGLLAITGSFAASYSAHKADLQSTDSRWRMGRDTRSALIMLGAISNLVLPVLWVVALLMNLTVVHRILSMRKREL
ncbi:NTP transferase domain-containing protein [Paenalcaligenes niemegkensis]|uniref:NTP transferase domain-containing protein n=1 Tax=Paenalcaligenes niemegkensis TaxID=2895469 RepID=UPI001EE93B67|nr:NTP transferase domain-containing protein [Paenalcaligenes niemegkensis]MCQ9617291.1 NTP transferase domain-containing protein [Paenalcaligenes niemegkensis]